MLLLATSLRSRVPAAGFTPSVTEVATSVVLTRCTGPGRGGGGVRKKTPGPGCQPPPEEGDKWGCPPQ